MASGRGLPLGRGVAEDLYLGILSLVLFPAVLVPPLQAWARSTLRPRVSLRASQSSHLVSRVQSLRLPAATRVVVAASSITVGLEFYVATFCVLAGMEQARFLVMLSSLLLTCLFAGNAMKDMICGPRPAAVAGSTGAVVAGREADKQREYGLPSSHVANSSCMAVYVIQALVRGGIAPAGWEGLMALIGAAWVAWIAWGRMYLGMHTPVDLVAGLLVGLGVVGAWTALEPRIEALLFGGVTSLLLLLSLFACVSAVYPRPEAPTPCYEQLVCFAGGVFGMDAGVLQRFPGGPPANRYLFAVSGPWGPPAAACLARTGLVLGAAVGTKFAAKPVSRLIVEAALDAFPEEVRQLWRTRAGGDGKEGAGGGKGAAEAGGRAGDVELAARFLTYATMGWMITEGIPGLLAWMGWW
eukprot:evm.model.scf_2108.2 EVM.evm.TU.scf_2108.2   scf_2108:15617-16852(+)